MVKKILRLGLSESTLLFIFWVENYKKINIKEENKKNNNILEVKKLIGNWLYTTSGYYDKQIKGSYFNFGYINDTNIYIEYMKTIYNILLNSDMLNLSFHCLSECNNNHLIEFKNSFGAKLINHISQEIIYDFIKGKNVLFISPFASLIKEQIISGNCKKIYNNFPDVNNIYTYKSEYTFFNNGKQNNILETFEVMYDEIIKQNNNFDVVVISCGAYSNLFANKFFKMNFDVLTTGGDLQKFFGILNNREKKWGYKPEYPEYWILDIPDEYKPPGYEKIEEGCYW
jgi:hypothetical protein